MRGRHIWENIALEAGVFPETPPVTARKPLAALVQSILSLLRRHQELGLPEALLRVSYSEHPPLPRPGAAPTTFYYIIPTLPQAGEGFLRTNQDFHPAGPDQNPQEVRPGRQDPHRSGRVPSGGDR